MSKVQIKPCKSLKWVDCNEDCDNCPIVEVGKVKHGRWLKTGQSFVYPDKFRNYFCSVCGFELDTHIRQEPNYCPNYCPNCGAKMDEVE